MIALLRQLEMNRFSGTIPPFIASLRNLTELYLAENSFIGTLPSEFSQLTRLEKQ